MKHSKPSKVPKPLPLWLCKAAWTGTATLYKIHAKDEHLAWENTWKLVSKTIGGDSCLQVIIIRRIE